MDSFNSTRPKRPRTTTPSGEDTDSIEAQLETMKAENAKLKKELDAKNAAIANLYIANTELKTSRPHDNDVNEDMVPEIERLKEAEAELQSKLVEAQTKMENERLQYEDEIHKQKLTLDARDNQIEELKEQVAVLKDVKVDLGTKNDDIEERLTSEKATLEAKINELNSIVDNLSKQIVKLTAAKQNTAETTTIYEKKIKELEERLQKIKIEKNLRNSLNRNARRSNVSSRSVRPQNNPIPEEYIINREVLERYFRFCADYRIISSLRPLKFEAFGNPNTVEPRYSAVQGTVIKPHYREVRSITRFNFFDYFLKNFYLNQFIAYKKPQLR